MSCKEVIPIDSPSWSQYNFHLIFYGEQGWNGQSGYQVHLTTSLKEKIPNFMYDHHVINYLWEWNEMISFLKYALTIPHKTLYLRKIIKQRGAFTVEERDIVHCHSE